MVSVLATLALATSINAPQVDSVKVISVDASKSTLSVVPKPQPAIVLEFKRRPRT